MSSVIANVAEPTAKFLRTPKSVVRRFVAKRTSRSALIFGLISVLYMLSKASSYIKAYPTELARQKVAESLGANVGIEALLGIAHRIDTIPGYLTWNFLTLIAAAGAIWAFLLATKTFRGEEDSGRWELFLAGQTTARRAATNALIGLGSGLVIIFLLMAMGMLSISRLNGADFSAESGLFLALSLTIGAAEFMAIGALCSQLMPVRSRAAGLSAIIFGIFYMIRLVADSTSAHWLLTLSPLGWIERLQPMYNSQPLWMLPIIGFITVLCGMTIWLAGERDLGEGILADKDISRPHTRLLHSPFGAAFRLNRASILSWLLAVILGAFLYGELAKSASQVLMTSSVKTVVNRLTQTAESQAVLAFLGFSLFFVMLIILFYVASAVGRIRDDEAKGYIDNFLVRPVSRTRWLWGRLVIVAGVIVIASLLGSFSTWAGGASQHLGVSFHLLLLAGVNIVAPAVLILGIGTFAFGAIPRFTNLLTYGAIGWSFLILMLGSGLNLNHWLLDTSILHHIAFAPAVDIKWLTNIVMFVIGTVLISIGLWRFNVRDLETE